MYFKHAPSGDLIEVVDLPDVINPNSPTIRARAHTDETIRHPENFLKSELVFLSGEPLPLCWVDAHYHSHAAA